MEKIQTEEYIENSNNLIFFGEIIGMASIGFIKKFDEKLKRWPSDKPGGYKENRYIMSTFGKVLDKGKQALRGITGMAEPACFETLDKLMKRLDFEIMCYKISHEKKWHIKKVRVVYKRTKAKHFDEELNDVEFE